MLNLLLNLLFSYFIIGVAISVISDITIRVVRSSDPFTFADIWACILFWPIVVAGFVKGFINGEDN